MDGRRILLEIMKFLYALTVGGVLFLFLCLVLDIFAYLVGGGWNQFLSPWPIFTGTVGSLVYGGLGATLFMVLGMGTVARLVLGKHVPSALTGLAQPRDEESV